MQPLAFLQLMQLASPALPVGGFSYSEGLEAAVDSGRVGTEHATQAWLLDQLNLALARADLPACAQAPAKTAAPAAARAESRSPRTILIADDEAIIRNILLRTLQMHGFTVLVAQNGAEAVELFQAHQETVDLVLLDVMMPKLDGVRAHERIHALRPDTKVIFMSGHATAQAEDIIRSHPGNFIAKPFAPTELARQVQDILGS